MQEVLGGNKVRRQPLLPLTALTFNTVTCLGRSVATAMSPNRIGGQIFRTTGHHRCSSLREWQHCPWGLTMSARQERDVDGLRGVVKGV